MGSFEKLGILVIVVIIVMILAVAIYQWGGADAPSDLARRSSGVTAEMRVKPSTKSGPREVDYLPPESGSATVRLKAAEIGCALQRPIY